LGEWPRIVLDVVAGFAATVEGLGGRGTEGDRRTGEMEG